MSYRRTGRSGQRLLGKEDWTRKIGQEILDKEELTRKIGQGRQGKGIGTTGKSNRMGWKGRKRDGQCGEEKAGELVN